MKPNRHSSEADINALEAVIERLANFGEELSLEWVDGYFTALITGPRLVPASEWLPAMLGDAFERAYADPQDVVQASTAFLARWNVLTRQLDPESLLDAPDELRLGPLMIGFDDAARAEIVAAGHMSAEEAEDNLQTGMIWADGFYSATLAFAADWVEPDIDTEEGRWYDDCLDRVLALTLDKAELQAHIAANYPGDTLTRDQLVDDACFGVQDLRVYWLDHVAKPATRRVDALPGRNDPCHCGSGKKFKKCHGTTLN